MMQRDPKRRLLWLLALAPPLVALVWTVMWASGAPEPYAWRELFGEPAVPLGWDQVAELEHPPHLVLFQATYVGLLSLPGSDYGRFTAMGWLLALLCCLVVQRLAARGAGAAAPPLLAPAILALLTSWCFSPAFGADWLLGSRFRVFVPALCMLLGMWLLTTGRRWRWRVLLAALLALIPLFVDRSGFLVWIGIAPVVLTEGLRRGAHRPVATFVTWCIVGNVGTLVSRYPFQTPAEAETVAPGIVDHFLEAPAAACRFVLEAAGGQVPRLWPDLASESAVVGGLVLALLPLLVLALALRRRDVSTWSSAAPWLGCACFGAGLAILACDTLYTVPEPWVRELGWAGFLLPAGVAGMAAALWPRAMRAAFFVLVPIGFALVAQDWHRGWEHLKVQRALLRQGEAQLAFVEVAIGELPGEPPPPILGETNIRALHAAGRLRGSRPVAGLNLGELPVAPEPPDARRGALERIDGETAHGYARAHTLEPAPDLVLLTRQLGEGPERIFRIAVPDVRRGKVFPWRADLAKVTPLVDGEIVRAYGFDLGTRHAHPLPGRFVMTDAGYRPAEEGR